MLTVRRQFPAATGGRRSAPRSVAVCAATAGFDRPAGGAARLSPSSEAATAAMIPAASPLVGRPAGGGARSPAALPSGSNAQASAPAAASPLMNRPAGGGSRLAAVPSGSGLGQAAASSIANRPTGGASRSAVFAKPELDAGGGDGGNGSGGEGGSGGSGGSGGGGAGDGADAGGRSSGGRDVAAFLSTWVLVCTAAYTAHYALLAPAAQAGSEPGKPPRAAAA